MCMLKWIKKTDLLGICKMESRYRLGFTKAFIANMLRCHDIFRNENNFRILTGTPNVLLIHTIEELNGIMCVFIVSTHLSYLKGRYKTL